MRRARLALQRLTLLIIKWLCCWREMKTTQCYFNMNLRLIRGTTFCLCISVKLKHAKELTYKLLHLYICCPCTDKCHLAGNACQNVTNTKKYTSCVSVTALFQGGTSFVDLLCFCSVLCLLCLCANLFICALWSPVGKGLTSWFSFVVSNCGFATFPLVSCVRCGT